MRGKILGYNRGSLLKRPCSRDMTIFRKATSEITLRVHVCKVCFIACICLWLGVAYLLVLSCHTHLFTSNIWEASKKRKVKSKLLHHFRGMGIQFNNGDKVGTKILQPHRMIMKRMWKHCRIKEKCILNCYVSSHAAMHRHIAFPCPCKTKLVQYGSTHNGMCRLKIGRASCRERV